MVEVQGIENHFVESTDENGVRFGTREVVWGEFKTVEQAVKAYCKKYASSIIPYDGSDPMIPLEENDKKYFYYHFANGTQALVDIHIIHADGCELCIKQDLSVTLQKGDTVYIGELAC